MEKFKTLNNRVARDIVRQACVGSYRCVYMMIYNYHDAFEFDVFHRLCKIVAEFAPLTLDVYNSLPFDVQSYFSSLWLQK